MPRSLLRMLAVALLALTVPVQGVAAVSAGVCMALGHHGDGLGVHDHSLAGDAHAHEHGDAADDHHHGGAGGDKDSHGAHCPPCVSCCAAAAIASFPSGFVPEQPGNWVVGEIAVSFYAVPPDRLDRPPLAL